MEISLEEKKTIEKLKHYVNITAYWKKEEYTNTEIDNYIKIVINLIEKQQNRIDELEKALIDEDYKWHDKLLQYDKTLEKLQKETIWKHKIEDKIKEYDGLKNIDLSAYEEQVKPLNELLEE